MSLANTKQVLFSPRWLLFTNTGLTVGLSITGDAFQQWYQSTYQQKNKPWDKKRTIRMGATGLMMAPFIHYWYICLDQWFPGRTFRILWRKVLLDQLICSPVYVSIFVLSLGIMEGQTWRKIKVDLKAKGAVLYATEWAVWPPAQFVNFYFLPSRYRVLYDSTVSLAFDVFWSYVWYEMDIDEDTGDTNKNEDTDCKQVKNEDDIRSNPLKSRWKEQM